jgi:hypothetical protein
MEELTINIKQYKIPQKMLRATLIYYSLLGWSIVFLAYLGATDAQHTSAAIGLAILTTLQALYNTRFDPNRCLPCAAMKGCKINE